MHTSRDNSNRKSKTCEALEILGADKPFGENVKRVEDLDLDKDPSLKHDSKEYT